MTDVAFQPFTVGAYLRLRREAADIAIGDPDFDLPEAAVTEIETDVREPTLGELGEYLFHVELDTSILTAIAVGGQTAIEATGECCRHCACSYSDACQTEAGPCAWSDDFDGVCTNSACLQKARAAA